MKCMSIGCWEDGTDWRSKMRVSREFLWRWCCYFAQQRWLPFHKGTVISVYIFNAIQRIKLQIGGKRICCISIYVLESYVYKLNRTLTRLRFVFCIGERKGRVTDWLAWHLGGFWLQGLDNPLSFLIFSCALLRVMRHFLTVLYFWIKNCLNI